MIRGRHFRTGRCIGVHVKDGRIEAVRGGSGGPWVGPGFVDLQVNGYRGLDFNAIPVPDDLPGRLTRELWREGVTSYCPTIVTQHPDAIEQAVRAVARACARDPDAAAGIAGIHLEGPFISPEDGPRGAHDRAFVRPPDWGLFDRWQRAAEGRIRILTMSPEYPGSADFIRRCTAAGVIVSIGHTAATPDQIREAARAGARMSTHLGNGAHLTLPRHPNYLWEQLARDELAACVIADGFHLPDSVLKVILRAKAGNVLLVSDAVHLAGLEPGEYRTPVGGRVVLTPEGRLHLAENPALLAGSAQMLRAGVENLIRRGLCALGEAWDMASTRPASLLGLPARMGLWKGAPADLVLVEEREGRLVIRETWKAGRRVFAASEDGAGGGGRFLA